MVLLFADWPCMVATQNLQPDEEMKEKPLARLCIAGCKTIGCDQTYKVDALRWRRLTHGGDAGK